jgi:hypothetical protein
LVFEGWMIGRGETMDAQERARMKHDRLMKARQRLQNRVLTSVRNIVLGTALFRSHPELHDPDVSVTVYAQFVLVTTSLNGGQLEILPVDGRARDLNEFAEQLREGLETLAADLHLPMVQDPGSPLGRSGPIMVLDTPSGYQAVLLRQEGK